MKKFIIAISKILINTTIKLKELIQSILCTLGFHKYISHVSGRFEKCQHCHKINYDIKV